MSLWRSSLSLPSRLYYPVYLQAAPIRQKITNKKPRTPKHLKACLKVSPMCLKNFKSSPSSTKVHLQLVLVLSTPQAPLMLRLTAGRR